MKGEESDGEMESFSRDFVSVDKRPPVSVDRYEAKRTRGAA